MKGFLSVVLLSTIVLGACARKGAGGRGTGTSSTSFTTPVKFQITHESGDADATGLLVGKFTNDDFNDLIVLTEQGAILYKNISDADGPSFWDRNDIDISATKNFRGLAIDINLDSDSILDLIMFNQSGSLQLWKNNGTGSFSVQDTLALAGRIANNLAYAQKKISGSGASYRKGHLFAATSNGGGNFSVHQSSFLFDAAIDPHTEIGVQAGSKVIAADLNNDGYTDFTVCPRDGSTNLRLYKNNTDTSISAEAQFTRDFSEDMNDFDVVDMEGSALPDLVVASSSGIEVYENKGSFDFSLSRLMRPNRLDMSVRKLLVNDMTLDDQKDFFLIPSTGGSAQLWTQQTAGIFSEITSSAFTSGSLQESPLAIYAGDLDNNGAPDLIELSSSGDVAVHINEIEP